MEETLENIKKEKARKTTARRTQEEKRRKLLEDKKLKQEELMRQEQERQEKKDKKRVLEERWAMMKWITSYIDRNEEKWARGKKERKENQTKWQEDWARMARHEKIWKIREKAGLNMNNNNLKITLNPPKLDHCHTTPNPSQVPSLVDAAAAQPMQVSPTQP